MNKRNVVILASLLLLTACATQSPVPVNATDLPGFFTGLWHGWIAVFAMIGHLFDSSIRVYEAPNSGGWYDFGFLVGIGAFGGGCSCAR